jgi:hypothetical protein
MRMRLTRIRHGAAAWCATLALLMLVAAPTLARLRSAADTASWVPVCTAQGLVQVQTLASGEKVPNPAEHIAADDSPYCRLHAHVPLLPSAERGVAVPLVRGAEVPTPAPALARAATPWPPAQARAPPAA